jgi:hypothetical protein
MSDDLLAQLVKAVNDGNDLVQDTVTMLRGKGINHYDVAAFLCNYYSRDPRFSNAMMGFNALAKQVKELVQKGTEKYDYLNQFDPTDLVRAVQSMAGPRVNTYSPLTLTSYLHSIGIPCVIADDKISYHFPRGVVEQRLVMGYPECNTDLYDALTAQFPSVDVVLLPFDEDVYEFATYIIQLFDIDYRTRSIKVGKLEALTKLTGPMPSIYSKGLESKGVSTLKQYLFPDKSAETESLCIRLVTAPSKIDAWYGWAVNYKKVTKTFPTILDLVRKMFTVDDKQLKGVATQALQGGAASVQRYLDDSRNFRGKNSTVISSMTRMSHIVKCLPESYSTAEKWYDVVRDLEKYLGEDQVFVPENERVEYQDSKEKFQTYFPKHVKKHLMVSGCAPGNFLPLFENVQAAEIEERVKGLQGAEELVSNRTFVDKMPCNRKDYMWDEGDVFSYPVLPGEYWISDCWDKRFAADKDLDVFVKSVINRLSGYHKLGTKWMLTEPVRRFAIKFVYRIDKSQKLTSLDRDYIPPPYKFLFEYMEENELHLTKIGRPHNGEFLMSNFSIDDGSFLVTNFKEAATVVRRDIVVGNLGRLIQTVMPLSTLCNPSPCRLTLEEVPVFQTLNVSPTDAKSLLDVFDGLVDISKQITARTMIGKDDIPQEAKIDAPIKQQQPLVSKADSVPKMNTPVDVKIEGEAPVNLVTVKEKEPVYDDRYSQDDDVSRRLVDAFTVSPPVSSSAPPRSGRKKPRIFVSLDT